MTIRPATPADADAIAEVHVSAWRCAYAGLIPQAYLDELDAGQFSASWHHSLSEPRAENIIVTTDASGAIVGFCVYGPSRDEDAKQDRVGELMAINLLPSVWRQGYGSRLLDYVLADAKAQKWNSLVLWVLHENTRARALYEHFGFVQDGAKKKNTRLADFPVHELRYRKWIR